MHMRVLPLIPLGLVGLLGCHAARAAGVEPARASGAVPDAPLMLAAHDSLAAGTLRGLLVPEFPGYPTRGVEVEAVDVGRTRADSAGVFELRGLAPGTHQIRVRAVGFRPLDAAIRMPTAGSIVRITLAVPRHCLHACTGPTRQPDSHIAAVP